MPKGKTLEQFRAVHDRTQVLKARAAAALKALGDSWEYEADFIRRAGVAMSEWGAIRENYMAHIVLVKASFGRGSNGNARRVIAGTPAFAKKLKESING